MVLDSSALIAIVLKEPGFESILKKADSARFIILGAPTASEAGIVLSSRLKRDARPILMELKRNLNIDIVSFDENHYSAAVAAFLRFGKGRHRAALNFGDCMTYALAKLSGLPLLYSGLDFSYTDVQSA
jgi:ribonuclease VapC